MSAKSDCAFFHAYQAECFAFTIRFKAIAVVPNGHGPPLAPQAARDGAPPSKMAATMPSTAQARRGTRGPGLALAGELSA